MLLGVERALMEVDGIRTWVKVDGSSNHPLVLLQTERDENKSLGISNSIQNHWKMRSAPK
jgi:hypothetical protein